jgi:hypothetical protein
MAQPIPKGITLAEARRLPAFRLTTPNDPIRYVDRYTLGHFMVGFLSGMRGVIPWYGSLALAVGWELIENPLKQAVAQIFPVAIPDTIENAAIDVAAWMAGFGASQLLPLEKKLPGQE